MSTADDVAKQNTLINLYLDNERKNDIFKYLFVALVLISIFIGGYFVREKSRTGTK